MPAYIFQALARKGAVDGIDNTIVQRDTRTWFRTNAAAVTRVNPNKMMGASDSLQNKITINDIGGMFMFFYDPKHKKTLPYYDTFPLIFVVDFTPDGFYGINLHYLEPILRAKLMDSLYTITNNKRYDDSTKIKLSYDVLNSASRFRYFKPCFKRYLWTHVQTQFLYIEPRSWDAALMLPTERFQKARKQNVWTDSGNKV